MPARIEPLANLDDALAREQHPRARSKQVEHVIAPPLAADLVNVAKAPRGQEADPRAFAFEQGVERDGRAVQKERYRFLAELAGEILADGLHHRGWLRGVGQILADGDELVLVIGSDIGERAADVDADPQFHEAGFCRRKRAVASASTSRSGVSSTP